MNILRALLEKKGIEAIEAGGKRSPGEQAFCVKICSKIITSQFCCVLLNNEMKDGHSFPNANVNMEYGLMLGFNKYLIPFQREGESLPFNVAGLDTIKYTNSNFESLASDALDHAIAATTPSSGAPIDLNQKLQTYLVSRDLSFARTTSEGDRAIFDLGSGLGFNLLIDFSGTRYAFLGNFTPFRSEAIIWRVRMLCRAIDQRRSSWEARIKAGVITKESALVVDELFSRFEILLIVSTDNDRQVVRDVLKNTISYKVDVVSLTDVDQSLRLLDGALG
ncbi:MAG TPA: hypothetical protein VGJ33_07145 [Candidatus Angelobacter sp.]|jgi:hypothetical protein